MTTETPPAETSEPAPLSLVSRLTSVVAAPGEVFEQVRLAPVRHANWVVPALLFVVIGWIGSALVFSQPWALSQMGELQARALQEQVDQGKLSQAQADQAQAAMQRFVPIMAAVGGFGGPLFLGFTTPFLWGLLLWLLGTKVFKAGFPFLKAVEVAGLAAVIGALASALRTLLIFATGNLAAGPNATLLLASYNPTNVGHNLLALLDLMSFWKLAVLSLGLAVLARRAFAAPAVWIFGLALGLQSAMVSLPLLIQSLTRR